VRSLCLCNARKYLLFIQTRNNNIDRKKNRSNLGSFDQVLSYIQSNPYDSLIIRIEWSAYEETKFRTIGKACGASDFHAYLIDIPGIKKGQEDKERYAFISQSLWNHFDSSIRPMTLPGLIRHFKFLRKFDSKTPVPDSQHYKFTSGAFYGAPLGPARSTIEIPSVPSEGELRDSDYMKLTSRKKNFIEILDLFDVAIYNQEAALNRATSAIKFCFSDESLGTELSYGTKRTNWNHILNLVYEVNRKSRDSDHPEYMAQFEFE